MPEDEEGGSTPQKISKFNGTIAQLMRLDRLWDKAHKYVEGGQLQAWKWVLDRIWVELSEDSDEKDENKFWEFNRKITTAKDKDSLYKTLLEKEMFLRKMQNKQGKGTSYEDPESDW